MKNCQICHRNYSDQFQFCSRDGTKLQIKSSDPDVKHCALCGKYYPPSFDNCPIHGVAFGAVIEQPVPEQPLYETSEEKKFQSTNSWLLEQGVVAKDDDNPIPQFESAPESAPLKQLESDSPSRPAANTKELGLPPAITLNSLTQYSLDGYASADRRLIALMAVFVIFVLAGLGAYALTRPSKRENLGNTPLITSQSDPSDSFNESSDSKSIEPVDKQANAEPENGADGEEIVQRIDPEFVQQIPLPSSMSDAKPASSISQPPKRTSSIPASNRSNGRKSPAQPSSSKSPSSPPQAAAQGDSKRAPASAADKGSSNSKAADDPRKPVLPNRTETAAEKILNSDSSGNGQNRHSNQDYRNSDPQASNNDVYSKPKASSRRIAKIVGRIANKSRTRIPNGYIYQFDLILREANGLSIRWRSIDARKVAFSGKSAIIDGLAADDKDPDNEAQYRIVVRMTGSCIEDWFGQLITKALGTDENGDSVELEQTLLLDDSFPLYSSNDSYRTRSYLRNR